MLLISLNYMKIVEHVIFLWKSRCYPQRYKFTADVKNYQCIANYSVCLERGLKADIKKGMVPSSFIGLMIGLSYHKILNMIDACCGLKFLCTYQSYSFICPTIWYHVGSTWDTYGDDKCKANISAWQTGKLICTHVPLDATTFCNHFA
jgi:hypothetical protein